MLRVLGGVLVAWLGAAPLSSAQSVGAESGGYDLERERVEGLPPADKPRPDFPNPADDAPPPLLNYKAEPLPYQPTLPPPEVGVAPVPKPTWERLLPYHIAAGFGRYLTPEVVATAANGERGRNPRLSWMGQFRHLTGLKGQVEGANFMDNAVLGRVRYYYDRHTAYGHINFEHNRLNFFGDTSVLALPERPDSAKQRFARLEFVGGLRKNFDTKKGFYYDANLRFRYLGTRQDNNEFHFTLRPDLAYRLNTTWTVEAPVRFTFSRLQGTALGDASSEQFFVDLAPRAVYQRGALYAMAGLRLAHFNAATNNTGFYGQLDVRYYLRDSSIVPFLRLGGETIYHQRYDLVGQNPYLDPSLSIILPTDEKVRLEGGLNARFGAFQMGAEGFFRWRENQPVFYSPPADTFGVGTDQPGLPGGRQGYFQVLYESDFKWYGATLSLHYGPERLPMVGARFTAQSFGLDDLPEYFHEPKLTGQVYMGYQLPEKFKAQAELDFIGQRPLGLDLAGELVNGDFFLDLNLFAEYFLSRRISLYLRLDNLLNFKYQRWYGYQERRLDVRGGATFQF